MTRVDEHAAPLRVLLVEDDEDDYLITREYLSGHARARFEIDWCSEYEAALVAIREDRHDVYLVDYRLGQRTGLQLIRQAFATRPGAPVILLTGQSDYAIDLEATALGVTDYLVKQELDAQSLERSIRYAVSHHRTISELARSEQRYALAARAANDGIWDWDLVSGRVYYSPRWHAILGYPEADSYENLDAWFGRVHQDDLAALRQAIDAHLRGQSEHLKSEHRIRDASGNWRWVLARGLAIRGEDRATRMAGSLTDITDRLQAEVKLQHDALHDTLTGLPNRALFMDRVGHLMGRSHRDPQLSYSVLFLDVDRFKRINDTLSHAVGDELLTGVAARIGGVLRPGDTVARMGGDEFTILLADVANGEEAMAVARRVQSVLANAFSIAGHELFVTASIGIAHGAQGLEPSALIRNADIAMYNAKRRGRGGCVLFDESMRRTLVDRLALESDLRVALENDLLQVHYQPVVSLESGEVKGLEALARWPEGWNPVSPVDFIAVAEDSGLICELGLAVLKTALDRLAAWRRAGVVAADVAMSVNVSARQLDDANLAESIIALIKASGLPPEVVRLEITESTLMSEPERMRTVFRKLCDAGVGLHLDDFGTGYSSLSALHAFPVSALKIDRGFVALMREDGGGEVIVRSTIALAHSLGLGVVAEGIEEPEQLERLQVLGCELGQGYLFSRPVAHPEAEALLRNWSPRGPAPRLSAGVR